MHRKILKILFRISTKVYTESECFKYFLKELKATNRPTII